MSPQFTDEDERREHWERKIKEMKRKKQQQQQRLRMMKYGVAVLGGICVIGVLVLIGKNIFQKDDGAVVNAAGVVDEQSEAEKENATEGDNQDIGKLTDDTTGNSDTGKLAGDTDTGKNSDYTASKTDTTAALNGDVFSNYGILIDLSQGTVVAERNSSTRINPASMTKILTVLVAAEHVKSLTDTFTITKEITDYSYVNDCSNTGFEDGETVTVKDLFYGTILPSGADAALGLATYTAGSQEAFVKLMNDKLVELGLSDTAHVTNCIGIYDEKHYCTVYDMAMILKAAMENDLCKEVLSTHTYTTSSTTQHPDGITISNWFLRRIEDKDSGGTVVGGKTGYVVQSGNCAASYASALNGNGYICVTADATSGWRCIYDHVAIYKQYLPQS